MSSLMVSVGVGVPVVKFPLVRTAAWAGPKVRMARTAAASVIGFVFFCLGNRQLTRNKKMRQSSWKVRASRSDHSFSCRRGRFFHFNISAFFRDRSGQHEKRNHPDHRSEREKPKLHRRLKVGVHSADGERTEKRLTEHPGKWQQKHRDDRLHPTRRHGLQNALPRIAEILMSAVMLLERQKHIGAEPPHISAEPTAMATPSVSSPVIFELASEPGNFPSLRSVKAIRHFATRCWRCGSHTPRHRDRGADVRF